MLKLIILSLLGKKIVSSRVLYNSIKSYLIIYMLILPAFLHAMVAIDASEYGSTRVELNTSVRNLSEEDAFHQPKSSYSEEFRTLRSGGAELTVRFPY